MDMGLSELRELVMDKEAWSVGIHEVTKSQTQLSDWTELMDLEYLNLVFPIISFILDSHFARDFY